MKYGHTKQLKISFDEAISRVKEELPKEGFGILTEIDVKATMKKKLDVDYDNYIILGACNPDFAHRALAVEKEVGLLLPCNVIVYEEGGDVFVSAIAPRRAMGVAENKELDGIAEEVDEKLKRVINNLN